MTRLGTTSRTARKRLDDRPFKAKTRTRLCFQDSKFNTYVDPARIDKFTSPQMSVGATHVHLAGHGIMHCLGMDLNDISSLYYLLSAHGEDDGPPPLEEYNDTFNIDAYMPEP